MLRLQDGRVVDISVDRARYYALRRGVSRAAGLQQLHQVVDVIYRQCGACGEVRHGWNEYDYVYSGMTAAEVRTNAADWSEEDKTRFGVWLQEPNQTRRIRGVWRRLPEEHVSFSVKLNSAPQNLYSELRRRVAALPMQRASVGQWRATILNMTHAGVRQEEIDWSGVLQQLQRHGDERDKLHRDQILGYINFPNLRLELSAEQIWGERGVLSFREVAQRLPHQAIYRAALKLDDSCHCVLRYLDDSCNYRVGVVKTLRYGHCMALNKFWFALDPYGRPLRNEQNDSLFYDSSEPALQAARRHAAQVWGLKGGVSFHSRYDHLTLYGGSDYREWLLTLPDYQRTFFGGHYYDHNVLVHIRTTTRSDHKGRKLLFIEELQSDWHQCGNREGYDNHWWGKVANAPFKRDWPALAIKLMLIRASQNGFDGVAWTPGEIQESRYAKPLAAIRRHYDVEVPHALNRLGRYCATRVENTWIETKDPWLNMVRSKDKWQVSDGCGKFATRPRYSREEAMEVMARHSKAIDLQVPVFLINDALRWRIASGGLPLFGEYLD
jgi:hypothetical protein